MIWQIIVSIGFLVLFLFLFLILFYDPSRWCLVYFFGKGSSFEVDILSGILTVFIRVHLVFQFLLPDVDFILNHQGIIWLLAFIWIFIKFVQSWFCFGNIFLVFYFVYTWLILWVYAWKKVLPYLLVFFLIIIFFLSLLPLLIILFIKLRFLLVNLRFQLFPAKISLWWLEFVLVYV